MAHDTCNPDNLSQPFLRQPRHPSSPPDVHETTGVIQCRAPAGDTACEPEPVKALKDEVIARIRLWSSFFAIAIQLDPPVSSEDPDPGHTALAEVLTSMAEDFQAFWFHWEETLYGCVIPEVTLEKAGEAASELQRRLALKCESTVTIGMARYPLISFSRTQTLANACKALDHAAFFGPGGTAVFDGVSLNISGDHCYQKGHLETAIAEYQDALLLDPDNINVHNSLGVCRAELKDYPAARECFRTVLSLSPGEPMATYNLGVIHLLCNETRQALTFFEKADAHNTNAFQIPYQIGKIRVEQGQLEKAKPYLERAVSLYSDSSGAFCLLGQCLAAEDKIREAIQAFKKAVKINPNDAAALSALGCLYDRKGENPDICLTFSRQSVMLAPGNGEFRLHLARLYEKYGHLDLALSEFEQAIGLGYDCQEQIDDLNARLQAGDSRASQCA